MVSASAMRMPVVPTTPTMGMSATPSMRMSVLHELAHFRGTVGVENAEHNDIKCDPASGRNDHGIGVNVKVSVDDPLHSHKHQDARQQPDHHDGK